MEEVKTVEAPPQRKKRPWYSIGFVVFVCILVGTVLYLESKKFVSTNDAIIEGYRVDLSPDITQKIDTIYVDEGDVVKEGQIIAQMDNDIPLSQKVEAEANVVSLQAAVRVKEAHFMKIRNDYERALKAVQDRIISAQEFDHRQKDYDMAKADLEFANANLDLSIAQLEVIKTRLEHYIVTAPRDGVIAKRWILSGDVVQQGQAMFTMYDLQNVWVLANLDETKIAPVCIGDSVDIHVDAYPGYTFHGKVFVIKGAAASQFSIIPQDNATGNYTKVAQRVPIKITIEPPENFPKDCPLYLFPGMSVEVKIRVK